VESISFSPAIAEVFREETVVYALGPTVRDDSQTPIAADGAAAGRDESVQDLTDRPQLLKCRSSERQLIADSLHCVRLLTITRPVYGFSKTRILFTRPPRTPTKFI